MPKYPSYYKTGSCYKGSTYYAILTCHRNVKVSKIKGRFTIEVVGGFSEHLYNDEFKEISGEEFYNQYLMVRRHINKQCINLINSLKKTKGDKNETQNSTPSKMSAQRDSMYPK